MKDLCVLAGFGMGMFVGMMVYKHSTEARKMVDAAEKAVVDNAGVIDKTVKQNIDKIEKKIKK